MKSRIFLVLIALQFFSYLLTFNLKIQSYLFILIRYLVLELSKQLSCLLLWCGLQAIDFDPTDATLHSNRSLCWIRLGQAEHALADAKACRALRPDWAKACYREGAALRLLQACSHPHEVLHCHFQVKPEMYNCFFTAEI